MSLREQLINELSQLGLSEKETRVYYAALAIKQAPVQTIARGSGIKRVTTYVILESLMDKGLVSKITKNKKTEFRAENPENLERFLTDQAKQIERQREALTKLLPQLKNLHELPAQKPEISYYVGTEALKTSLYQLLNENKKHLETPVYSMTSNTRRRELFKPGELDDYFEKRKQVPMRSKVFHEGKPLVETKYSETIILDQPIEADINFLKEKVSIITYTNPVVGMLISDKNVTKTLRRLFEMAWETQSAKQRKAVKKR